MLNRKPIYHINTMIKNIIFDFGGVIAGLTREKSVQALEALGLKDADKILDQYHQTGIFQQLDEGKLGADEFRQELGKLCGKVPTEEQTTYAWLCFLKEIDVRKLRFIEELRKSSYRTYLLSNTNPFLMSWACSEAFSADKKPLNSYFDKLYLSYEMGCAKPSPEIFEKMIADSGINPSESLFVDDSAVNAAAGRKFGFTTLQPANGEDWRDTLAEMLK